MGALGGCLRVLANVLVVLVALLFLLSRVPPANHPAVTRVDPAKTAGLDLTQQVDVEEQELFEDEMETVPKDGYRARYERYWPEEAQWAETQAAKQRFLAQYSSAGEYGYDGQVESIVRDNLKRLSNEVYLDYTGASLLQEGQIKKVYEHLSSVAYGNSHSLNPSASRTEAAVDAMRRRILKHFNASPRDYTVIFTSGTTGALKLVADSFPWTNASTFVYLRQNHNSVLGIREVALDQGARFVAIPETEMDGDVCNKFMGGEPCGGNVGAPTHSRHVLLTQFPETTFNLFAFPAMDNFAGVKYPLDWINMFKARARGEFGTGHWLTLLDAAAFVPTHNLDLSKYPADFVTMSFYKMFGYPTGLGALLVRNDVTELMQKTFFGGGTVIASTCDTHFCLLHRNPCNRFEDGTVSFLGIVALRYGFDELEKLGMDNISKHVLALSQYLYDEVSALKHSTGVPLATVFGKHALRDKSKQGSIVTFTLADEHNLPIGYHDVQKAATAAKFHVRTGCHCNPGACYGYLNITSDEVQRFSLTRESCGDEHDVMDGRHLGSVRVSVGYLTTFEDVHAFVQFLKSTFVH